MLKEKWITLYDIDGNIVNYSVVLFGVQYFVKPVCKYTIREYGLHPFSYDLYKVESYYEVSSIRLDFFKSKIKSLTNAKVEIVRDFKSYWKTHYEFLL